MTRRIILISLIFSSLVLSLTLNNQLNLATTQECPIIYTVQEGDTLNMIAQQYNTSVEDICLLNGIVDPDYITIGQEIYIPCIEPSGEELTEEPSGEETEEPSGEETEEPSAEETEEPSGEELTEEPSGEETEEPSAEEEAGCPGKHTVMEGETLEAIAETYNLRGEDIIAANNLASDRVMVGMGLIIPCKEEETTEEEEPSTPREEPSTPREGPSTPRERPSTPREGPPREEPSTSREVPSTPREEPSTPREGPSTPREEPSTPREEPSTPREGPSTPREEPSTPREEPSTPREESNTPEENLNPQPEPPGVVNSIESPEINEFSAPTSEDIIIL